MNGAQIILEMLKLYEVKHVFYVRSLKFGINQTGQLQ